MQVPFANLRYDTGKEHELSWQCQVNAFETDRWGDMDCEWVGNTLRPGNYKPRGVKLRQPAL